MIYGTILMRNTELINLVVAKLIERQTCNRVCGFESRLRQELLVGGVNNEHSLHLQYPD